MKQDTHTPAPWRLVDGDYPGIMEIKIGDFESITRVVSATDISGDDFVEKMSNNYLISAAPEMFDCLCKLQKMFERNKSEEEFLADLIKNQDLALDIHSAILKARGMV